MRATQVAGRLRRVEALQTPRTHPLELDTVAAEPNGRSVRLRTSGRLALARGVSQGLSTTFTHSSRLCLKVSYPVGASSSDMRCVTMKLGSISPFSTRSSSGRR